MQAEVIADAGAAVMRAGVAPPVAAFGVDLAGNVIAWNPAAERLFGWTAEEAVGRRLPTVPQDLWAEFESALNVGARGVTIPRRTARRLRRDGIQMLVELDTAPIRDGRGVVTGLLTLATEINPAAAVPQVASARMEAVGRLAAGAAHDFNNVLMAIAGYAGLLADELPPADPGQMHVAEIRKAAERAMRLTSQLLAFGRRDAREPRRLDLDEIVTGVLPMLRQLVGEQIELATDTAVPPPFVLADPGQLEQVLVNLVLNARDAMPDGGRVVVSTTTVDLGHDFVQAHPGAHPGAFVRLTVEDTGTGMDTDILSHIFEPYFTTKPPGRGTGLGLSTVYGIVKQSDGYVWAESSPGRGTTMIVDLPAR